MQTATDSQEPISRSNSSRQQSITVSRAEKRIAFRQALSNGLSVIEAARASGIPESTAFRMVKQTKQKEAQLIADNGSIVSRDESLAILSTLARDPNESGKVRVAALSEANKTAGYNAPIRTESLVIHASVAQQLEASRLKLEAAAHAATALPPKPPEGS